MTPHRHYCIRCRASWDCDRKGMDYEAESLCASRSHRPSLCQACMARLADEVPKSFVDGSKENRKVCMTDSLYRRKMT